MERNGGIEERPERIERLLIASKNVFTVSDLATYLGLSEKTIYNRLDSIPHYKSGTRTYFRREEIERWLCRVKCSPVEL